LIFVDTGAWFALKAPDDRFHDQAVTFHDELVTGRHGSLVVSDYILDETSTLLMDVKGGGVAAAFLDEALKSRVFVSSGWTHNCSIRPQTCSRVAAREDGVLLIAQASNSCIV